MVERALNRPEPEPDSAARYLFAETKPDGSPDLQIMGGLAAEGHRFPVTTQGPDPERPHEVGPGGVFHVLLQPRHSHAVKAVSAR